MPETKRHLDLRTTLYLVLKYALADRAVIGSDQFVYWDPTDPRACLAPDAFLKLGRPDEDFDSWKVWERGAPDLAVEIVSRSDAREADGEDKLSGYRSMGVKELVRFDPNAPLCMLRLWDNVEGDLVERVLDDAKDGRSAVVPYYWLVVGTEAGPTLRLSEDAEGRRLVPTHEEVAAREGKRATEEARRASEEAKRADAAEAENARLRARLEALEKS